MKALILSQNYQFYTGGYYHQDWINALASTIDCDIYGPGYLDYDPDDDIETVFSKFAKTANDYDLVIMSTSWDKSGQLQGDGNVDIHPRISLGHIANIKKIYFLNKEYINLQAKLDYAESNGVDLIISVMPEAWFESNGIKLSTSFLCLPFAIDFSRIVTNIKSRYDFSFTGALHTSYLDERWCVKKELFNENVSILQSILLWAGRSIYPKKNWDFLISGHNIPSNKGIFRMLSVTNPLTKRARQYDIYWAERHPLSKTLFGRNLLPFGENYFRLLSSSRSFLCTRSADGIIGPRFYELMASDSVIICPKGEYDGLLISGQNCLMYSAPQDVIPLIAKLKNDQLFHSTLIKNARETVKNHSYLARVNKLVNFIKDDLYD